MDILRQRRLVAIFLASLIGLVLLPATSNAAMLLRFDFEQADGSYTATPTMAVPGLSAYWQDAGHLTDLAGVSGRALASSGFTTGNVVHLIIELAPGLVLAADRLSFALRASSSGPNSWQLAADGISQAAGAATTVFKTFDLGLALAPRSGALQFDLHGLGATSAAGTLRLDNVQLSGELTTVALPGPLFLVATPLFGLAAGQWRQRRSQLGT